MLSEGQALSHISLSGRACFSTILTMLAAGQLFVMSVWVSLCYGYALFIYPGNLDQNLSFNYIDVVHFTWTSSINEPYMNLWCAPNSSVHQSNDYLYHEQVPTNGSNPQSFSYPGYEQKGICHMQVESFSGDDFINTPPFNIMSNDGAGPITWGLDDLIKAGGSPDSSTIQALPSVPSSVLAAAASTPSSSATSTALSLSASSGTIVPSTSLTSPTSVSTTQSPPPPEHSSQSSSNNNTNTNTGLTPGAKAGISIGGIIAFLLMALLLLLAWYLRSRQRQRQRAKSQVEVQEKEQRAAEIEERNISRYEVDGESMRNELQGRPRAELLGDLGALER